MDTEFVNAYIERLVRECSEMLKTKMLADTQISLMSSRYNELLKKNKELEEQVQALEANLNKKTSKANKEQNTF